MSCLCCLESSPESSAVANETLWRPGGLFIQAGTTMLNLGVIGFYRQVKDLIVDVDDGSGDTTITANRADEVKVRGGSIVASAAVTSAVAGFLGHTYTSSERRNELAGGYPAVAGIPKDQIQASLDVHPADDRND